MPNLQRIARLCLTALLLSACSFVVQPIERYTSPDGFVRIEHPLAWKVYQTPDEGDYPGVALQTGLPPDFPQPRQASFPADAAMLALLVFPPRTPDLSANFQIPVHSFVQFTAQQIGRSFAAPDESAEVSEPFPVEIGLEVETYAAVADSAQAQVLVYGYQVAEGTIALAMLVVEPGGNPALQMQAEAIIRTLRLLASPQTIAERYLGE